jgi:hypothetical protein
MDSEDHCQRERECKMQIRQVEQKHQIKVEPMEWEGKPRIDVRLWVYAEELGKMIPTKRGLSVRLDQIDEIQRGLTEARNVLSRAA